MNNIYFERINNRYRGPFEKEKFSFLVNEIDKNLNFLYARVTAQRSAIINLYDLSENTDLSKNADGTSILEIDSSELAGQKVFETRFRDKLKLLNDKLTKESLRDMIKNTTDYLDDVIETIDNGGV